MAEIVDLGYGRGYKLTEADAEQIDRRRTDAYRARKGRLRWGMIIHTGNKVQPGDICLVIVTKIVGVDEEDNTIFNGQVLLDGNDTLWVKNVTYGPNPGQWSNL